MAGEHTILQSGVGLESNPAGVVLLNTYIVERRLAEGGMAVVYLARHADLQTLHVIKIIRSELLVEANASDMFGREAEALRSIRHECVVGYEGYQRDDQGRHYLIMEYVDGPSLAEVMAQRTLNLGELYVLRDRLVAGLAAAHAKDVIHRDLSPDNIILLGGDPAKAKLIDFGLAKSMVPGAPSFVGDNIAGKLRYASPEQLRVTDNTAIGPYSDVYGLGLVLAAAALSTPLDMGGSYERACQKREGIPDLSAVPPALRAQLAEMLNPQPSKRPQSVSEIVQRWRAPERGGQRHGAASASRSGKRVAVWSVILIVLLGVALGAWRLYEQRTAEKSEHVACNDLRKVAQDTVAAMFDCANGFMVEHRLNDALVLYETAAKQGHGGSAFALATMYDPILSGRVPSPLKPNRRKAQQWYRAAEAQGVAGASARLKELEP
ncbi:MAG: protein kinase domain-containing protein [Gammaproteobacteria bacterium]